MMVLSGGNMDYEKLNRILSFFIFLGLLVLLIFINVYGISPCKKCSFEIDGENLNIKEFFNLFADKCLVVRENVDLFWEGVFNQS